MITTQPIPTIPLWAWELDVPLQSALSAGYLWATWWLMCSKDRLAADTNGLSVTRLPRSNFAGPDKAWQISGDGFHTARRVGCWGGCGFLF